MPIMSTTVSTATGIIIGWRRLSRLLLVPEGAWHPREQVANGRKEMLSRNTRCSVRMHIIFIPFIINSICHFRRIALFRIKLRLKAFAL